MPTLHRIEDAVALLDAWIAYARSLEAELDDVALALARMSDEAYEEYGRARTGCPF